MQLPGTVHLRAAGNSHRTGDRVHRLSFNDGHHAEMGVGQLLNLGSVRRAPCGGGQHLTPVTAGNQHRHPAPSTQWELLHRPPSKRHVTYRILVVDAFGNGSHDLWPLHFPVNFPARWNDVGGDIVGVAAVQVLLRSPARRAGHGGRPQARRKALRYLPGVGTPARPGGRRARPRQRPAEHVSAAGGRQPNQQRSPAGCLPLPASRPDAPGLHGRLLTMISIFSLALSSSLSIMNPCL